MAFNVTLANTYLEWLTAYNLAVNQLSGITEGDFVKPTGNVIVYGASGVASLNVVSGFIKGNGAGIINIPIGSIVGKVNNATLQNSTINITSSSPALNVSGTGTLGSNVILSIVASDRTNDFSTTNVATSNTVSRTWTLAVSANSVAYDAKSDAAGALAMAVNAYAAANTKFNSSGGTISGATTITGNLTITGAIVNLL